METKRCSRCHEVKPLGAFHSDKRRHDGLRRQCKVCASVLAKVSHSRNRERLREQQRRWRAATPEKSKQYVQRYKERTDAWAKAHPECRRAIASKTVKELKPFYVAKRLGLPVAELTPELLALKREQLEVTRLSRQLKKALKDTK